MATKSNVFVKGSRFRLKRWVAFTVLFFVTAAAGNVRSMENDILPSLPEHLVWQHDKNLNHTVIASAADFAALLDEKDFILKEIRESGLVPPIYAVNLPSDLSSLPVGEKTSLFISLLLPNVVKVNSAIVQVRKEVLALVGKVGQSEKLNADERQWLVGIADDYSGSVDNLEDLLQRVDSIPNSLVLAQAIDESGWGTSHFAIAGNALYGEHLPTRSRGKYLTTPGGHVKVAAFDSLYHCTASYIHNLNSTRAYKELRAYRNKLRQNKKKLTGHDLATSLTMYSARGEKYVHTLQSIISHYRLEVFDDARFRTDVSGLAVEFKRKKLGKK